MCVCVRLAAAGITVHVFICAFVSFCVHVHISLFLAVPNAASNLQVTATVNSLKPTWVAPATGGDVTYTVTLKDGDEVKETKDGITETTTTFNKLIAGKQFIVIVVSVIGGQNSDPLQGNFYTSKSQLLVGCAHAQVLSILCAFSAVYYLILYY